VDNAVRSGGSAAQAFKILERTAVHLGARSCEPLGAGIGAGEAEHRVASADQFPNDGCADEAGGPGNKNTHLSIPPTQRPFGFRPAPQNGPTTADWLKRRMSPNP